MSILHDVDDKILKNSDLVHVNETDLCIRRIKKGNGYSYQNADGDTITDDAIRERFGALAIPPSYNDVYYCLIDNGHILATGYDGSGKKQYFYHPEWEKLREQSKFTTLSLFAEKLPTFRRAVRAMIKDDDKIDHDTILGIMLRILDKTGMRVGNEGSAKKHDTYGLTTLKKSHVEVDDNQTHFTYQGKGGMDLDKVMTDAKVAHAVENCSELKGQRLFEYKDEKGKLHHIDSGDINRIIKDIMDPKFSAKDFRTWRFSCYFMDELLHLSDKSEKASLKSILETVAEQSGNTAAILQSSYIHPGLIKLAKDNDWPFVKKLKETELSETTMAERIFASYLATKHASAIFETDD